MHEETSFHALQYPGLSFWNQGLSDGKGRVGMEIGKPQRVFRIEPVEDPVPEPLFVPDEAPAPVGAPEGAPEAVPA
jgi:hypothetical protein